MSFKIHYEILSSQTGALLPDLFVRDVIGRIRSIQSNGGAIVKMTFFLDAAHTGPFGHTKAYISNALKNCFPEQAPPTVFLAQAPLTGPLYAVELTVVIPASSAINVQYKSLGNFNYSVVENGDARWVFLGIDNHHISEQNFNALVHNTFDVAGNILKTENMSFKQVIRQWNYIENITSSTQNSSGDYQFYQIFNDIRALFYENNNLRFDFPAATGIGCVNGGFALELVALNSPDDFRSVSIKSPVQKNAYEYSAGVLVGDAVHPFAKQAPLFERAKIVLFQNEGIVYVSGTAVISGEASVEILDAESQTEITIKNIFELLTENNLRMNKVHRKIGKMHPSYIRAYVKNKEHNSLVERVCKKYFNGAPLLLVHSDVCRDELLVEIEAAFHCQFL